MSDSSPGLSRRKWLGLMAPPTLLAAAGATARAGDEGGAIRAAPTNDRGARIYNIRDFGAAGDGQTLDTAALQSAIDACTNDGGGTVLVPAGIFHIGTTELKSNVTLHIVAGGVLLGSGEGRNYHGVDAIPLSGDSTLGDGNWALLFAVDAKNVTIEGPGRIDGNGHLFHPAVRHGIPPAGLTGGKRPYHMLFHRCEHLAVRNIQMWNSAYHSIRIIQSRHVLLNGIHIWSRVSGNNDGFHFISAEHVAISNCEIESQDDACALFGSCKFVTVTNCTFSTRWSVFRFGGGTPENITVSNCVIHQVFGCPIKFHGGPGSVFQNMSFSNLVLDEVTGPITISIGHYSPRAFADGSAKTATVPQRPRREESGGPPVVRNISFSNIHGTVTTTPRPLPESDVVSEYGAGEKHSCITLNCAPGSDGVLENISFDNIHLTFGGGGTAEDAARRDLPPIAGEYFFLGPMPAYGFYARYARGITLNNVRFQVATREMRPAVILDHVDDVAVSGLGVQGEPGVEVIRLRQVRDVNISGLRVLTKAGPWLVVEGGPSSGITRDGGDTTKAEPLSLRDGTPADAVKWRE